jgi:tetratricopeptide (TPR) repeat protein
MLPVLVFDQFEEIFTLRDSAFRSVFANEIGALVSGHPPDSARVRAMAGDKGTVISDTPPKVKIILSLREEYLGALQELSTGIPMLFQDRIRLLPLSEKQARDAIQKPAILGTSSAPVKQKAEFFSKPFQYDKSALEDMLKFLKGRSDSIEPFQLQLLCQHIESHVLGKKLKSKEQTPDAELITITADDIGGPTAMKHVLQKFYTSAINDVHRKERNRTRLLCESGLLTTAGHRISLEENQIYDDYHISKGTLQFLVNRRVLRREPRLESLFYELSHDTLAQSILEIRRWRIPKRYRLALLVGAISLILFLLFGGLFINRFYDERQESDRARKKAENLVGFLISDELSQMVNPVGRLEMKEHIQQEVNNYFDSISHEGLTQLSSSNQGLAKINQGEVLEDKGQLQLARDNYWVAKSIFSALVQEDPGNMKWRRHLAKANHKLGKIAYFQLRLKEALDLHKAAFKIRTDNIHDFGKKEQLLKDLAKSHWAIGNIRMKQGYVQEALEHYSQVIQITNSYMETSSDIKEWTYFLQDGYEGLADVYEVRGDYVRAEKIYAEGIVRAEQPVRLSPFEPEAKYRLGIAIYRHARVLVDKNPRKALEGQQRLYGIVKEMNQWDPDNAFWKREFAATLVVVGQTYTTLGDTKTALARYKKALSLFEELSQIDESHANWQEDIVWVHENIGALAGSEYKNEDALDHFNQSIEIQERLVRIDDSNNAASDRLATLYVQKANLLRAEKNFDTALEFYRRALNTLEKRVYVDPTDVNYLYSLGWTHFELARAYQMKGDIENEAIASQNALMKQSPARMPCTIWSWPSI